MGYVFVGAVEAVVGLFDVHMQGGSRDFAYGKSHHLGAYEEHNSLKHALIVGEVVQHAASLVALISSHSIVGLFAAKPVEESSDGGKIVARKRLYVVVGVGGEKFVHVVSLLLHLVSGKGSELVGAVDVVAPMAQLGNFRGIERTEVVDAFFGDCRKLQCDAFGVAVVLEQLYRFAQRHCTQRQREGCALHIVLGNALNEQCVAVDAIVILEVVDPHIDSTHRVVARTAARRVKIWQHKGQRIECESVKVQALVVGSHNRRINHSVNRAVNQQPTVHLLPGSSESSLVVITQQA